MLRNIIALLLMIGGMIMSQPLWAHTRSQSHSAWLIDGASVHLSFTAPDLEAARISPDGRAPDDARFLGYLAPRVGVTAHGEPCHVSTPPRMVAAAAGFRRAEFAFLCPDARDMALRSAAFIDLVPSHTNFAQIQTVKGEFFEQLLTHDQPSVGVSGPASEHRLEDAGFLKFVAMGIMHIFTGIDHMSFLVGLVLISRRLRDLVFVVTGFTIGHSLTLALAVTGIIRPHAEFIDALVALTIALIGIENVGAATHRSRLVAIWTGGALLLMTGLRLLGIGVLPPLLLLGAGLFASNYLLVSGHLRDAGRVRLVVTLVFGLIHGFGFAADLLESRLPAGRLAELLLGFNLGVEIGQLTLVLALTLATAFLVRRHWALPRPIVADVAAACLVGLGTYWFVARSFV
jgi:hypothetical protein